MNDLAGRVRSEAEAQELVDAVAAMFADELPPVWSAESIRKRIARAEHKAVVDPFRLIPEQRISELWNEYVREIGLPDEMLVRAAEIHNMRDAGYASAQIAWPHLQSIWTMPNIYSLGSDGKVSNGCRALDALRLIFEIHNIFDNVRLARERLEKGIVFSDHMKQSRGATPAGQKMTARVEVRVSTNPIRSAEFRYIREKGVQNFTQVLQRFFNELFPE